MKKLVVLILAMIMSLMSMAQKYISTIPEKGTVILELYTGIHCGACPSGHENAENMKEFEPYDIDIISIHAGVLAVPDEGEEDFRTVYGEKYKEEMGVYGYPSATVNRNFPGKDNVFAKFSSSWRSVSRRESEELSPVNLGVQSIFDDESRTLTITVDLYYTGSHASPLNYINIAFLENGFVSPQSDFDFSSGTNHFYVHNHILRDMITGQWGDEVTETLKGSSVTRTYTYIVPNEYDIEDCEVVAYVSESERNIYNGHTVKANGGSTLIIGELNYSKKYFNGQIAEQSNSTITLTNELPHEETYTMRMDLNSPYGWSSNVTLDGTSVASGSQITIPAGASKSIEIGIIPGNNVGVGSLNLEFTSNTYHATSRALNYTMNVICGVTDLVVSNYSVLHQDGFYRKSLLEAKNETFGMTTREIMIGFALENLLSDVNNIYYNVGKVLSGLNNKTVEVLSDFMDKGGNLMIVGQDIGWDNFSENESAFGTDVQRNFISNYLHADYLADGTEENDLVTAVTEDPYFGTCSNVGFDESSSSYSPSTSPEELAPINEGKAIFNYNNGSKIGGIRAETEDYKMVYLGFGIESMSDEELAYAIVGKVHDWFYDLLIPMEPTEDLITSIFPNPTSSLLNVTFEEGLSSNRKVKMTDVNGIVVLEESLSDDQYDIRLNIENLISGMYIIELTTNDGLLLTEKIIVH